MTIILEDRPKRTQYSTFRAPQRNFMKGAPSRQMAAITGVLPDAVGITTHYAFAMYDPHDYASNAAGLGIVP